MCNGTLLRRIQSERRTAPQSPAELRTRARTLLVIPILMVPQGFFGLNWIVFDQSLVSDHGERANDSSLSLSSARFPAPNGKMMDCLVRNRIASSPSCLRYCVVQSDSRSRTPKALLENAPQLSQNGMIPGSSTVEHSAVNRRVASSNLARGANLFVVNHLKQDEKRVPLQISAGRLTNVV